MSIRKILENIEIDTIKEIYLYNLKSSKSPLLSEYYDKTAIWTLLERSVVDETLIKLIIFNLDFNISPLHVFLKYYEKELQNVVLTKFTSRCIGAHIAYLLASLGYKRTRRTYRKDAIIKYGGFYELEDATIAE